MADYPTSIHEFPEYVDKNPATGIQGTKWDKAHVEEITEEVLAIETELGTEPKGTDASVKARFERIENDLPLWALLGA